MYRGPPAGPASQAEDSLVRWAPRRPHEMDRTGEVSMVERQSGPAAEHQYEHYDPQIR